MRHKMTFSHFSKDLIRPNLGEESGCGLLCIKRGWHCANPSLVNSVYLYSCLFSEVSFLPWYSPVRVRRKATMEEMSASLSSMSHW